MGDDSNALIGSVIDGRYRIEALLGQGAVGTVYRAVEVATGERVALKQWHAIALNDEVRGRFLREATALVTLDHPNIVQVVGHGFVNGVPYVALEYLEGQTLGALIGGQPLEPGLTFQIARQALSAIAYAHAHQVVHRDLKPENIFVTRDAHGRVTVKILDYGLAKFMAAESVLGSASAPLTAMGTMIGTPLYMPPEQAVGSSVDLAADVYSIGCVLFEMLTGQPPFMADTRRELITAHLLAPIPSLADALPGMRVAPELQALIEHALAKRQTERLPNAGAMFEALNRLPPSPITPRDVAPPSTPPTPHTERTSVREEPAKASSARVWVAAALLAAIALLLVRAC
jgi:eukaryotic-like serine/threonine-protein kinase